MSRRRAGRGAPPVCRPPCFGSAGARNYRPSSPTRAAWRARARSCARSPRCGAGPSRSPCTVRNLRGRIRGRSTVLRGCHTPHSSCARGCHRTRGGTPGTTSRPSDAGTRSGSYDRTRSSRYRSRMDRDVQGTRGTRAVLLDDSAERRAAEAAAWRAGRAALARRRRAPRSTVAAEAASGGVLPHPALASGRQHCSSTTAVVPSGAVVGAEGPRPRLRALFWAHWCSSVHQLPGRSPPRPLGHVALRHPAGRTPHT